jgi:hypothetical protein
MVFNKDDDADQIRQTNRTAAAVTHAAADAIQTLEGRTATEDAIDQVVAETVVDIEAAPDAEAVRRAEEAEAQAVAEKAKAAELAAEYQAKLDKLRSIV